MSKSGSGAYYKIGVSLAFGLMGFAANFYPLDVLIPPNKASFVWGLVFPMLISLSWGWRYGLLSATLGLGAQTMWFLWLPQNGWAVFVAVPVYNGWIVWHGWCAGNRRNRMLSNIYWADIPYRIFFAIIFATVFSWSFRFNPSPWAPHMTLTAAPPAFIKFIQFKVIVEGYMVLLLADVLRNLRIFKRILLIRDDGGNRSDFILSGAALLGLCFWVVSAIAHYIYDKGELSLADRLILDMSAQDLAERLLVIGICLVAGLLISKYFSKYMESERKYRDVVQGVDDLMSRVDPDGRFIFVNHMSGKFLGLTPEQCIGMSAFGFIHPDDAEATADWFSRTIGKKAPGGTIENRQVSVDGRVAHVLWNSTFHYDEDGRLLFIDSIARDITERKVAEDRLRESEANLVKAQEIAHLGSWEWDLAHNTLRWSEEIYRIFGLSPHEFGSTYEDFLGSVHPEDRPFVKKAVDDAINAGVHYSIDHRIVLPDGTEKVVHEQAELIRDEAGRAIFMNGTVLDITERVRASMQIEKSLREKEVLLKEIHHRVKNNMAVINALMSLQATYVKDPVAIEQFRETQNRVRAMSLVHEKLYATSDFGKISFREYVESLAGHVMASVGRDAALEVKIQDIGLEPDTMVPCGLIINEVLTNALKHAFDGRPGECRVSVSAQRSDAGLIALEISDNGKGLPEGFDPAGARSGLGLRLVMSLTGQLGGEMSVESDGGARFRFVFPESLEFSKPGI